MQSKPLDMLGKHSIFEPLKPGMGHVKTASPQQAIRSHWICVSLNTQWTHQSQMNAPAAIPQYHSLHLHGHQPQPTGETGTSGEDHSNSGQGRTSWPQNRMTDWRTSLIFMFTSNERCLPQDWPLMNIQSTFHSSKENHINMLKCYSHVQGPGHYLLFVWLVEFFFCCFWDSLTA